MPVMPSRTLPNIGTGGGGGAFRVSMTYSKTLLYDGCLDGSIGARLARRNVMCCVVSACDGIGVCACVCE